MGKTVHLEWQGIAEMENLDVFEQAEVLYMQYNRIARIEGLESMIRLQFLALQNNFISAVENLKHLRELEFLDLSRNKIQDFNERELPITINMLRMRGNPCAEKSDYKQRLVAHLTELTHLDELELSAGIDQSASISTAALDRVELAAGETGLSAYWRKDELRSGLASNTSSEIQAYAVEALADCDGFSGRVDGALERSRGRQQETEVSASTSLNEKQLEDVRRLKAKLLEKQEKLVVDLDNKQTRTGPVDTTPAESAAGGS